MIRDVTGHGAFLAAGGRAEDGKPSQPKEKVAEATQQTTVERTGEQSILQPGGEARVVAPPPPPIGHELRYEVDEDLNKVLIKIVDGDSGELVRQIPAEELVRLAKVLEWTNGQLLDRRI